MNPDLPVDYEGLAGFCRQWRITTVSLFGSALRGDFRSDSDVDVLVDFQPGARWTLPDPAQMRDELETLFGRKVDLLTRRGVQQSRNAIRKQAILSTAQVLYEP